MRKLALLATLFALPLATAAVIAVANATPQHIPGASGTVFVTERQIGSASAYDAATGDPLWSHRVGLTPIGITQPHGTNKVYTSDEGSNQMSVLDRATGEPIKVIPGVARAHHLMASTDGRHVYVAEFSRNTVGVIDTDLDEKVRNLVANPDPAARTHAVYVPVHDKFVYATNTRDVRTSLGDIAKIDVESGIPVWNFMIGRDPSEILVTPDENVAYVTVRQEHAVKVVDISGESPSILATVPIGIEPDTLQLTNDRRWLVVGLRDTAGAKMALMNTETLGVRTVPLTGRTTGHQWLSANGKYTFIAIEGPPSGGVAVVDNEAGEQIDFYPYPTPPGGSRPHGVFYDPQVLR